MGEGLKGSDGAMSPRMNGIDEWLPTEYGNIWVRVRWCWWAMVGADVAENELLRRWFANEVRGLAFIRVWQ
jgi:hypothetical protein